MGRNTLLLSHPLCDTPTPLSDALIPDPFFFHQDCPFIA